MRRYDIVAGILLILSIVDFALAAPILVQEKHQERVDVANAPRDVTVTTMLRKRWDEELEKLGEEAAQYFKTSGKSIDSSGTHPSSSSAPYPASSTSNPDQSTEPCCSPSSSSSTSMQGLSARGNACWKSCIDLMKDMDSVGIPPDVAMGGPMLYTSSSHSYGTAHALPTTEAPAPQLMSSADPNIDWDSWMNTPDEPLPPSPPRPKMPTDPGQASGHAPGPPPTESVIPPPSPGAESPTEPEQEVVPGPPPSPASELQLDHQLLNADSQPVDLEAAINRVKGKAKELRHISGTALDVGNAAQR
jgi:hypothetical protein